MVCICIVSSFCGMCCSVAIHQDVSGTARERAFALGVAIGSGYLYETNFKKEVLSDLTGERGTLMGAIQGLYHPPTLTPRTGTPRHAIPRTCTCASARILLHSAYRRLADRRNFEFWVCVQVSSWHSTRCSVRTVTLRPRRSTRRSRKRPSRSTLSSRTMGWTGCTPTAAPPRR
jgi:hypothetical protein